MAVCKAGAAAAGVPLYQHIAALAGKDTSKFTLPVPCFNGIFSILRYPQLTISHQWRLARYLCASNNNLY